MREAIIPVVAAMASWFAGYLAGKRAGYAEAVREHLDNLKRQTTKNWYRQLEKMKGRSE